MHMYQIGRDVGELQTSFQQQSETIGNHDKRLSKLELRQAILMRVVFMTVVFSLSAAGQLNREQLATLGAGLLKKWLMGGLI